MGPDAGSEYDATCWEGDGAPSGATTGGGASACRGVTEMLISAGCSCGGKAGATDVWISGAAWLATAC